MLARGDTAPDFELPDENGDPVRLSDYEGQRVVLYFYPKAHTGGCTTEAVGFRDNWAAFEDAGVAVIGVSADPIDDIASFKAEHDLPFPLLSDPEGDVASRYETFGSTEIRGETYDIAFRNTYVIGENGEIERVYEDVDPEGHAGEIIDDL